MNYLKMRKNRLLVLISLMAAVIFISGCAQGGGFSLANFGKKQVMTPEEEAAARALIYRGTDGIVINFAKDMPPSIVYDVEPMTLGFEVRNKGAKDATLVHLFISGIDPAWLDSATVDSAAASTLKTDGIDAKTIEGKELVRGEGGYRLVTVQLKKKELSAGTDTYKPNIVVNACYKYATIANPIICVDPEPFKGTAGSKACKISDVLIASGQGAPIAVTKVEETMIGGEKPELQLRIFVENVGKGTAFYTLPDTNTKANTYDCRNFDITSLNKIKATVAGFTCTPSDTLQLIEGKGILFCKKTPEAASAAYTMPINIQLDYGYMSSASQLVEIKKAS